MAKKLITVGVVIGSFTLAACEVRPAPADEVQVKAQRLDRLQSEVNALAADLAELDAIEGRCLAEAARNPNAVSCDWGSREDAARWERGRAGRVGE